jgi:transcriptional regulator with XRE-family HTH domain
MDDISQHVRALRRRADVSQEHFAKLCGLTRLQIFDLESGRNKGTSAAIREGLARGAKMSLDQLSEFLSAKAPADGRKPFRASGRAA